MTRIKKNSSGTIEFTRKGDAFLISESKGINKDIFIPKDKTGKALNGDSVVVKLVFNESQQSYEGAVVGINKRFKTEFVGIVEQLQNSENCLVRTSSKKVSVDFFIPKKNLGEALPGDKVSVKISKWNEGYSNPIGIVKKVFGKAGEHATEMQSILFENDIDSTFTKRVTNESDAIEFDIPASEIEKREDFRETITFTIDPKDAKDFDDALSFKKLEEDIYEIGVHIADVGHYVTPGSELDKEAYKRATSIYLVDRVIPMLPERLSNGVCSLRPNEDKLAFSTIFKIKFTVDGSIHILDERYAKVVIRSGKRYSYEEAQTVIEEAAKDASYGGDSFGNSMDDFDLAVVTMDKMAKSFRKIRFNNGAISFDKKEVRFKLDEDKQPIGVYFKESKDSNKLIEEFMLLANQSVAAFIGKQGFPCIYRTHALPALEKLQELSAFVKQFGFDFNVSENEEDNKSSMNKLLAEVKGTNYANIIETVAVRSMAKAIYTTQILGHYGLGFKFYSHFTSPIRRYPDVILHRLLFKLLKYKTLSTPELQIWCEHCSAMENKASKAERDSIRFKQVEFMQNKVNQEFEGVVSGVSKFGLFVEIKENGCEGLCNNENILSQGFVLDEKNHKFVSEGKHISLGDTVKVYVEGVNLTKRQIEFKLVVNNG